MMTNRTTPASKDRTSAKTGDKYTIALDGKTWGRAFDALWDPVFSPDGKKLLCRCVENGKYFRRVVPVTEIK